MSFLNLSLSLFLSISPFLNILISNNIFLAALCAYTGAAVAARIHANVAV